MALAIIFAHLFFVMTPDELIRRFPKASPAFLRANSGGGETAQPVAPPVAPMNQSTTARPIRQKRAMNKAESLAMDDLRARYPDGKCIHEGITLSLGNGAKYTPDFAVTVGDWIGCFEVKAMRGERVHIEDDAAVKVKVAASAWPQFEFWITWFDRENGRQWFRVER